MQFTTIVHHGPDLLIVEGRGPALLADLFGYMDLTATIASQGGYRRALLDLRGVEIALSFTEHLHLGAYAAKQLAGLDRVASVVSVQNRKGTSEKAAQKMGLHFKTFTSMDEARAWIHENGE
jgi:hypothetical protein